jgi:acetyltransferase-like isoleucine patch superfamily enzyme
MAYRHLTKEEIENLLARNCFSGNWTGIMVKEGFSSENIINTRFEGNIKLGNYSGTIEIEKNIPKTCGIYDSYISNCEIADNVHISAVKILSNYIIEENVAISNVGSLCVNGESAFGNGTEIEVLNEGGGRELPIFDSLSSQIGYLTVLYRHDQDFTNKLHGLIREYCELKRSARGVIKKDARISDSLIIRNVNIGNNAVISGASYLEEGTIESCNEAPAFVGIGVVAKKFIILSGSRVDGGAILEKTFVGQGVNIGKQFSAENSVFFANCEAFHGEACSLFAGPFAVTHHKSTLMIACLVSFFNAGSGTNQSNHMYKLGPLHQGILERGSKTGSFSYMLFPDHIGAFTVVMGKHYSNFDTSDFPFSYITEEKGKSELTPAMNLFTVGTRRDVDKWPARDRRKDPVKLDLIHFDLFSPFIAERIINGINTLNELAEKSNVKQDYINYKGIAIRRLLLKTTRKYYEMALKLYIGQEVAKRIMDLADNSSLSDLKNMLSAEGTEGSGKWIDLGGLFSPAGKINELMESVKTGKIRSVDELSGMLAGIFNNYNKYAWEWCHSLINRQTGDNPENLPVDAIIQIITDWKSNAVKLNGMIMKDAEKEFDAGSKIGFGIDGDTDTRDRDFQSVRGVYDNNKFIISLRKESQEIEEKADRLITLLSRFK